MEKDTNASNSSINNFYHIFNVKNRTVNGLPEKAKAFNPPDQFSNLLQEKIDKLEKIIQAKQTAVKNASDGNLVIHKKGKGVEYYQSFEKSASLNTDTTHTSNKSRVYLSKKDSDFIHMLAQKAYDVKLLETARKQLALLSHIQQKYKESEISSLYDDLSVPRQALVDPIESPTQEFIHHWNSFQYPERQFTDEDPEIYTKRKERVQSKSERLIADTLYQNQIPYRYEFPIYFPGCNITYHPDFLVLNKRTRKIYMWEHLGIMDSLTYVTNNMNRLKVYEKSGFLPGINLILTFEDKNHPLNQTTIDEYIRYYLT